MTRSREDDRKRLAKATQPEPGKPTDLRTLCIIQGCLNPRHGTNMCRKCQNESDLTAESVR